MNIQGLENGKIAVEKEWIVDANWKTVYENNRECVHCFKSHPEYITANYDIFFIYDTDGSRILDPRTSPAKL